MQVLSTTEINTVLIFYTAASSHLDQNRSHCQVTSDELRKQARKIPIHGMNQSKKDMFIHDIMNQSMLTTVESWFQSHDTDTLGLQLFDSIFNVLFSLFQ